MGNRRAVTIGILLLFLVPLLAVAQFPGGGFPGKGGKGGGGKQRGGGPKIDPMQFFDQLSGGKDVWKRSDAQGFQVNMFDKIAQGLGITNGEITREQFRQQSQQWGQKGGNRGGGPPAPPPPTVDQLGEWDKQAEELFKKADANGDGQLNQDEMPQADGALRGEFQKWDLNNNGQIDLTEFKAFYRSHMQAKSGGGPAYADSGYGDEDQPLKRPDVYRAGNLPKEMPSWFAQLDIDGDGQIALYEWRRGGKMLAEFQVYDRNDDGFITAEEVLRIVAKNKPPSPSATQLAQNGQGGPAYSLPGTGPVIFAPPPGGNPFGNPFGKGGKGGKGNKGGGKGGKQRGNFGGN